ncbi:hypothetical protein SUGI_0979440 [Cryptomeria japonica]|uniref:transcription factor MYB4-like n=1 Tax=Cryptomeria japonica TaxID=3369 RepID=UPI002414AA0F|nr:transcription factor MYB4-like [Cryptomeria japonica]GLJ46474.1 hypothetical protein SUGI_0979440 [Cryptomeria japonica]
MVCKSCKDEKQRKKYTRGLWSPEEDSMLRNYVLRYGHGYWSEVPKLAGLKKSGKSCRLRWINYLRPGLKRGNFSYQEQKIIIDAHALLGNRWSHIASMLPGRTDNEIKNFWHTHLKKKIKVSGTDANAHKSSGDCTRKEASECKRTVPETESTDMQMDCFVRIPYGTEFSRISLQGGFEDISPNLVSKCLPDNNSLKDTLFSEGLYSEQSESSSFNMGCYNSVMCPQSTLDSENSNCTTYHLGLLNAVSEEYPFPEEIKQIINSSELTPLLHMPTLSSNGSNNSNSATSLNISKYWNGMNYNEVSLGMHEDYNLIGNCCLLDLDGFQINENVLKSIKG